MSRSCVFNPGGAPWASPWMVRASTALLPREVSNRRRNRVPMPSSRPRTRYTPACLRSSKLRDRRRKQHGAVHAMYPHMASESGRPARPVRSNLSMPIAGVRQRRRTWKPSLVLWGCRSLTNSGTCTCVQSIKDDRATAVTRVSLLPRKTHCALDPGLTTIH
jgi:hypothetical protein